MNMSTFKANFLDLFRINIFIFEPISPLFCPAFLFLLTCVGGLQHFKSGVINPDMWEKSHLRLSARATRYHRTFNFADRFINDDQSAIQMFRFVY